MVTPNGAQTACCDMVLNNTSWTLTGNGCPIAGTSDPVATRSVAGLPQSTIHEDPRNDVEWLAAATVIPARQN